MQKKKKVLMIAAAILTILIAAALYIISTNEYYLELNVPETITVEYGTDTFPEVKGICKGTILNRKGTEVALVTSGGLDLTVTGTYHLTYEAVYKDVPLVAERTIIVQDTTAPVIDLVANPDYFTSPIAEYVDATVIIGLKQNPTYGRRFSPIFLLYRAFCGAKRRMPL